MDLTHTITWDQNLTHTITWDHGIRNWCTGIDFEAATRLFKFCLLFREKVGQSKWHFIKYIYLSRNSSIQIPLNKSLLNTTRVRESWISESYPGLTEAFRESLIGTSLRIKFYQYLTTIWTKNSPGGNLWEKRNKSSEHRCPVHCMKSFSAQHRWGNSVILEILLSWRNTVQSPRKQTTSMESCRERKSL